MGSDAKTLSKQFNSFLMKEFWPLKRNQDRVNFAMGILRRFSINSSSMLIEDRKSDIEAEKFRKSGNSYFISGKYMLCLEMYTKSIASARSPEVLALGYGNRSAVLAKLKLYKECLVDIQRAFENNYPDHLSPKLFARKDVALESQVENDFEEAPKITRSKKNKSIQSASNCIKIKQSSLFRRHIVASRDIEIGELLAVETPYSTCVLSEVLIHCHECLELCYNLIPCENCTMSLYCSNSCKYKAFEKYHKYECQILLSLRVLNIDILALRIILMTKNNFDKFRELFWPELDPIYHSDRFKEVFNLLKIHNKLNCKTLYQLSETAAITYYLLKNHTCYFQDHFDIGNIENKFKNLILSLLCITHMHKRNISNLQQDTFGIFRIRDFGIGIYPLYTLFNHSCAPNVITHFHGSKIILRAGLSIKKGQECFVSYGYYYHIHTKEVRQSILKQIYNIRCTCKACQENWQRDGPERLSSTSMFYSFVQGMLAQSNLKFAKEHLPKLEYRLRQIEHNVPCQEVNVLIEFIRLCHLVMGNRKIVLDQ